MAGNTTVSIYDETGFFHSRRTVLPEEMGDVLIDDDAIGCVEGKHDGTAVWWDGSRVALRPTLPVPATKSVALGETWAILGLPIGTKVSVNGALVGVTEVMDEPVYFGETGTLYLTLDPFPYKNVEIEVTVS